MRRSPSLMEQLDAVLRLDDDGDFLTELADLLAPVHEVRREGVPPIRALSELFTSVTTHGSRYYLASEAGARFSDARRGCQGLEVASAVEFLDALRSQFPGQVVPTDDRQRARLVDESVLNTPQTKRSVFAELDARYEGSMYELSLALRRYVAAHVDEIAAIFDTGDGTLAAIPEQRTAHEAAALRGRASSAIETHQEATRQFTASFGIVPKLPEGEDQALDAFCRELGRLSDDEWRLVVRRFAEHLKQTKLAGRHVHTLPYEALYSRGEFDARVAHPAVKSFAHVMERARALPEHAHDEKGEMPLRAVALQAAREAWFAFSRRRWLGEREVDRAALKTLLAPFSGLVSSVAVSQ